MLKRSLKARVFDEEEAAIKAIHGGEIRPGDVIVIRFRRAQGRSGDAEMLAPTAAVAGMGLDKVALITDGRFRPPGGGDRAYLPGSHGQRSHRTGP